MTVALVVICVAIIVLGAVGILYAVEEIRERR